MFTVAKATSPQNDERKPPDNPSIGTVEDNNARDNKHHLKIPQEPGSTGSKFDQKKLEDLLSGFHKVFSENGYFSAISAKASSLSRNTTYAVGIIVLILIGLFLFRSAGTIQNGGKWVDFGNGMLNVDKCKRIIPEIFPSHFGAEGLKNEISNGRGQVGGSIKFDDFTLTVVQLHPISSLNEYEEAKSTVFNMYNTIISFIRSDKAYMQLRL